MSRWLAIAAYQCRINGTPTGSVDFQVRYFNLSSPSDVEAALRGEPPREYHNHLNETVAWPLVEIFAVERLEAVTSGDEIIGFIAGTKELASLVQPDAA